MNKKQQDEFENRLKALPGFKKAQKAFASPVMKQHNIDASFVIDDKFEKDVAKLIAETLLNDDSFSEQAKDELWQVMKEFDIEENKSRMVHVPEHISDLAATLPEKSMGVQDVLVRFGNLKAHKWATLCGEELIFQEDVDTEKISFVKILGGEWVAWKASPKLDSEETE